MHQRRDEELLADHLAGRPDAFEILVSRYVDALFGFFKRFVGNAAVAEDLVQETFLQVHLSAGAFDPQRRFKPWLFTVAANKARDYMRARGRRPMQSLDASPDSREPGAAAAERIEDAGPASVEQVEADETAARVRGVIASLPEHLGLILVLGHFQRLPYAEIAEILEIPVGTVKSRLHSAVNQFAAAWLEQEREAKA